MNGFIIADTRSKVEKTTVTLNILTALRRRRLKVQAFKIGSDFIDPGHHTEIIGVPSRILDGWMLSPLYNQRTFWQHLYGADVAVIESNDGIVRWVGWQNRGR